MWKRTKEDYRTVMDHLNMDTNNITMQLDTIATPRVSALDGGREDLSRNSFLESKRNSTRHGSAGPNDYYGGSSASHQAPSSSRRSAGASSLNPMNLFGNSVVPKEVQLRGDAVQALSKVAQLLSDKNTPPNLEMMLLDKGYQLIESLRTSRERLNRKSIKKGSYLTLMSALDKRRGGGHAAASVATRARASSLMGDGEGPCNPWCRVIEQNYWWPHHVHSVMGKLEERAFDSREPSPVPTSKSLHMEDPMRGWNTAGGGSNGNFNNTSIQQPNGAHGAGAGGTSPVRNNSGSVSLPMDDEHGELAGFSNSGRGNANNNANLFANSMSPNNGMGASMRSGGGGGAFNPMDSFSEVFTAQRAPTTADVPSLFYDESDLAMHALEMISDEEAKRGGMGVKLTGTKKQPAVVSEAYNQGLREHFIHAAHSKEHPMCIAIDAFLRYNASAILRISLPDALNIQPATESQIEMWDLSLDDNNKPSAIGPSVPVIRSRPQTPMESQVATPAMTPSNFLSVGNKLGQRQTLGVGLNAGVGSLSGPKRLSSATPPGNHNHHNDPLRATSMSRGYSSDRHQNNADLETLKVLKSIWGIVPSVEYEKQFLRDRLQFIQALCETVLDRMFSDKHIPVVVTSTHVDGMNARGVDKLSPARKGRGGRGGGGAAGNDNQSDRSGYNNDRNSAEGSVASTVNTYSGGVGGRLRTAIDLSFPFTEVLPEIIDSKLELLAVRSIFKWAEGFEANRRREQTEDDIENERLKIGALTPGLIRDNASRLLLEGTAHKLNDFLKAIADAIVANDMIFVDEMYDRLIDAMMIAYNIAETSRVKLPGTHTGADDVFPCIVYIVGTGRCAFLISALLRWTATSTVACRLPPFMSKGVEAYVLQSFSAAANAVVGCIMREGVGYGF